MGNNIKYEALWEELKEWLKRYKADRTKDEHSRYCIVLSIDDILQKMDEFEMAKIDMMSKKCLIKIKVSGHDRWVTELRYDENFEIIGSFLTSSKEEATVFDEPIAKEVAMNLNSRAKDIEFCLEEVEK